MTVLVLAEDYDPTVDRVVMTLSDRGVPVFRADLSWFPHKLTLDAELSGNRWVGVLRTPERETKLAGLRSVWYRSPTNFSFPATMPRARREHAEREARFGVGGVLATLPVMWMNHPQRGADNAYKPRQLTVAAQCGLNVPRTLVTNDADAVRRFAHNSRHGLIIKVLAANIIYESGQRKVAHTHLLTDDDLADLRHFEMPALFEHIAVAVGSDHRARVNRDPVPDPRARINHHAGMKRRVVAEFGARSTDEAISFVAELKKNGRFQQDVY